MSRRWQLLRYSNFFSRLEWKYCGRERAGYNETLLKDTTEMRTPLYSGDFAMSQIYFLNVNLPLK